MEKFSWFKDQNAKKEAEKIISNLDMTKNQEDDYGHTSSLEEERDFRELVGGYEKLSEKLEKLEDESIKIRNLQNQDFSDLNLELVNINNLIANFLEILRTYKEKKEKLSYLNQKNFKFHMSIDDINLPITKEEKEINELQNEVNELSRTITEERIEEILPELKEKSSKLKNKIDTFRDVWYPKNPEEN